MERSVRLWLAQQAGQGRSFWPWGITSRGPKQLALGVPGWILVLGNQSQVFCFWQQSVATRAAFQLALAWDATLSHLAIWKGFSSSWFLLECFHDPWAWKHLLTAGPGNKSSSQVTGTRLLMGPSYLRDTSKSRWMIDTPCSTVYYVEIAQWGRVPPAKHEDPSLNPSTPRTLVL